MKSSEFQSAEELKKLIDFYLEIIEHYKEGEKRCYEKIKKLQKEIEELK